MDIETLDKTLDKTLSTIRKVEKAICIPMALICIVAAIEDFSHSSHFQGNSICPRHRLLDEHGSNVLSHEAEVQS